MEFYNFSIYILLLFDLLEQKKWIKVILVILFHLRYYMFYLDLENNIKDRENNINHNKKGNYLYLILNHFINNYLFFI